MNVSGAMHQQLVLLCTPHTVLIIVMNSRHDCLLTCRHDTMRQLSSTLAVNTDNPARALATGPAKACRMPKGLDADINMPGVRPTADTPPLTPHTVAGASATC